MPEAVEDTLPKLSHRKRSELMAVLEEDCERLQASVSCVEIDRPESFREGTAAILRYSLEQRLALPVLLWCLIGAHGGGRKALLNFKVDSLSESA